MIDLVAHLGTTWCLTIGFADLGHLSGIVDLPLRTMLMSTTLDAAQRPSVARALLAAAGVVQPLPYDATCLCGKVLLLGDEEADVS